jgi:hypothetical protein
MGRVVWAQGNENASIYYITMHFLDARVRSDYL